MEEEWKKKIKLPTKRRARKGGKARKDGGSSGGGSSDEEKEEEEEEEAEAEKEEKGSKEDLYTRAMQRKKKREENQKIKETEELSHSFHPQTNIDKKELSPNGKKSIEYSEKLYQRGVEDLKRRDDRTIARYQESQMMMQQEGRFVPGTKLSTQMGIPPCLKKQRIGESRAIASPTTSRAYLPGGKVWSKPDVIDHSTVAHREFTEEQDRKFQTFLVASQTQIQRQEEKKRKDIIYGRLQYR